MRLALVSDAWLPQVNGVVRTLDRVRREVETLGHEVRVYSPDQFRTLPCPTYPEIRLAVDHWLKMGRLLDDFAPEAVHIATEGPLGLMARSVCLKRSWPFTTSYHTKFPEYVNARAPIPVSWGYRFMRWFHKPSKGVMVATPTIRAELEAEGFDNVKSWSRGVDTDLFHPEKQPALDLPRPIYLYVGRVAVEKNIEDFLGLEISSGSKVVVGDGPQRPALEQRYPDAVFTGAKFGEDLARHYASADVFVFPSRTDTFGLVLLEAMASGVPVAAYPVPGPLDVVSDHPVGALHENLSEAVKRTTSISRQDCRDYALRFSWTACAEQFLGNLHPLAKA